MFRFMTPALYMLGDIGYLNWNLFSLVQNIKETFNNNDKIILMGDNFYNHGITQDNDFRWSNYSVIFENIGFDNILSVMGNHDYEGDPRVQLESKYMKTNDFYFKYSFSQHTELFFIDTVQLYKNHCSIGEQHMKRIHNDTYENLENQQLTWLKYELEMSSASNKIIFGHYPIVTNGLYTYSLEPFKKKLLPILKKYNVKAYISGHEHNAQYINTFIDNYNLNQFIIGSSSENRYYEFNNPFHQDMFDNEDNYYLKMYEDENNSVIFEFINNKGESKYSYKI